MEYNDFERKQMDLLNEVLTAQEATIAWGLGESTLRTRIRNSNVFVEGIDYRKTGRSWLITRAAMERVYGPEKEIVIDEDIPF